MIKLSFSDFPCDDRVEGACRRYAHLTPLRPLYCQLCRNPRYATAFAEGWNPGNRAPKPDRPKRSRGLGDTIAKATRRLGFKPCGGCKKRQAWLNEKVPYRRKGRKPQKGKTR